MSGPGAWKAVRYEHGRDPFKHAERVYSSHATKQAAEGARDQSRSVMVEASGQEAADAWAWSVVHDPDGALVIPKG